MNHENCPIAKDITAVITSFNQGSMILEAVQFLYCQTTPPVKIILVDDGPADETSLDILKNIKPDLDLSVPVKVIFFQHYPIIY